MKINCNQFEGLMTFYLDNTLSERMSEAFESHLKECPNCEMKFRVIRSIIDDVKDAYNKILLDSGMEEYLSSDVAVDVSEQIEDISALDLSAYVDNELCDDKNIKMRKSIIARPGIRTKLDKLLKLKKVMNDAYLETKKKNKIDYSKVITRKLNNNITTRQVCIHCFGFLLVVIIAVALSVWAIVSVL